MDVMQRIFAAIPEHLRVWVNRHVRWGAGNLSPTACAFIDKETGYNIQFNPDFIAEVSDAELTGLWLHEISNVLRGDCLTRKDDIPVNWQAYVIAVEYVINDKLINQGVTLPDGGVTRATLEQYGPDVPLSIHSAVYIAEWISKRAPNLESMLQDFLIADNRGEVLQKHIEALMDLPSSIRTDLVKRSIVNKPLSLDIGPVAEVAAQLYSHAKGYYEVWQNSWARENYNSDVLPGYALLESSRIVLALDASGSMMEYIGMYWQIADALEALGAQVETWVWADIASFWPRGTDMPDVGGGTQLTPLLREFTDSPCVVVVLTDGEIADVESAPGYVGVCQLVWALVPNGKEPFPASLSITLKRI